MNETWIIITAGKGPAECAWAVPRVAERLRDEAEAAGIAVRTLEVSPGPREGTAESILLAVSAEIGLEPFLETWCGTVRWTARSPFRPAHKRKNWFVGIEALAPVEETRFHPRDVRVETMRASGPGGQHVNRTESAVRITHVPTGIQAIASEERSQHRNRHLAFARLARKLAERDEASHADSRETRWSLHQSVERGNPVRTFSN